MPRTMAVRVGALGGIPLSANISDGLGVGDSPALVRIVERAASDAIGGTDSASPSTATTITHGRQINATNTGIAGAGLVQGDLTVHGGGATYSTNGQTITGRYFTNTVNLAGNNITLRNCKIVVGGSDAWGVVVNGDGNTVENCTIVAPSGQSMYEGILNRGEDTTVLRCDVSFCENALTSDQPNLTVTESYFHDASKLSNPDGHRDLLEIFSADVMTASRCKFVMDNGETAPVNIAPWGGVVYARDVTIQDCYLDGGVNHIIVDYQGTAGGDILRTRILRNDMGGHTYPGYSNYRALLNSEGRSFVQTESALLASPSSILWPTSGADANYWVDCADLSPDRTGQIITP